MTGPAGPLGGRGSPRRQTAVTHSAHEIQQSYIDRLARRLADETTVPAHILRWFAEVPRHRFVGAIRDPGGLDLAVPLETTNERLLGHLYSDHAIAVKVAGGRCVASTSQPSLMAMMMADVDLQPGMKVLEIGSGTGWNAALMSHVVAPGGSVVSLEYEPDLAAAAADNLLRDGHRGVTVRHGDGAAGAPDLAPFDAIVVTVACPTVPAAWIDQLAPGGRLVTPLELPDRSSPMLVARRDGERLRGRFVRWSWFVQMQGGVPAWPPPLDATAPGVATVLGSWPALRAPLPSLCRHERLEAGFQLLVHEPERFGILGTSRVDEREIGRYVYWDGEGLGVLAEAELHGHGAPAMFELLRRRTEEWLGAGRQGAEQFEVTVQPAAGRPPRVGLRRGEVDLILDRGQQARSTSP